jgi:hypothetical protein
MGILFVTITKGHVTVEEKSAYRHSDGLKLLYTIHYTCITYRIVKLLCDHLNKRGCLVYTYAVWHTKNIFFNSYSEVYPMLKVYVVVGAHAPALYSKYIDYKNCVRFLGSFNSTPKMLKCSPTTCYHSLLLSEIFAIS